VWNIAKFKDVIYTIPDTMVKGKSHIRIKFEALPGNTAGPVYIMRLLRAEEKKQ